MTEIEPRRTEIMLPISGEVLDVALMPDAAKALEFLRDLKEKANDLIHFIEDTVSDEMSRQGSQTLHVGNRSLVRKVSKTWEWDFAELAKLTDLGLPDERFCDLVKPGKPTVSVREADRLAAINPEYGRVIEQARTLARERVSVDVKSI